MKLTLHYGIMEWLSIAIEIYVVLYFKNLFQSLTKNALAERTKLFGETAADNLLQCEPKDWTMLKKKIFDLFYDYQQGILNGTQQSLPFNANSFALPAFSPLTQHNSHLPQTNMILANSSHNQRNIYNSIISPSSNSSD